VRSGLAGGPRPGRLDGGPSAVRRQAPRPGRRDGRLGRPDLPQQGTGAQAGSRDARGRGSSARRCTTPSRTRTTVATGVPSWSSSRIG
jgi:hypothetical protein